MNGRIHIAGGMMILLLVWLAMIVYSLYNPIFEFPPFWAFFAGGILGCTWPDFDFIWGNGTAAFHRSTLTHSCLLTVVATASYLFSPEYGLTLMLLFVNLGITTHLWFDMIYNDVPEEYEKSVWTRWEYRWKRMKERKVGGVLKGPFATRKKKGRWLFYNGLVCVILAIVLFVKIVYRIDIDWWFR